MLCEETIQITLTYAIYTSYICMYIKDTNTIILYISCNISCLYKFIYIYVCKLYTVYVCIYNISKSAYIILLHVFKLKTSQDSRFWKTIPNRLTKRAAAPAGLIPVQLVLRHAARAKATKQANKQPRSMKNLPLSKRVHVEMATFEKRFGFSCST